MPTAARQVQTAQTAVVNAPPVALARNCSAHILITEHPLPATPQVALRPRLLARSGWNFNRSRMEHESVEPEAVEAVLVLPRIWCGFRRTIMKKLLMLAAAASLVATMANAQTTVTTTGAAPAAVQIEPQYRTKIKTYITENKVRPVQSKEKIVVGAKVPSDVELVAVPSDWGPSLTKYRYVYSGDRVMLVDPGTRTVVQEVD
jgi:hypothetical protein